MLPKELICPFERISVNPLHEDLERRYMGKWIFDEKPGTNTIYISEARGNGKSESMRRYLEQEVNKIKNDENNGGVDMKSAYCAFCVSRNGFGITCEHCNGFNKFRQDTSGTIDYSKKDVRGPEAAYKLNPGCITIEHLIEKVIFNGPATIIVWKCGRKTVVKAQPGEPFDPEKGMAMAIAKYVMGNKGAFNNVFNKWCAPYVEQRYNELIEDLKQDKRITPDVPADVIEEIEFVEKSNNTEE